MNRYIKDFGSLEQRHMMLIKNQYPKGFTERDVVSLKTAKGSYLNALEVHTADAIYLVKISQALLEHFEDEESFEVGADREIDLAAELDSEYLED
ncbi:MAG: hypothetical protein KDC12_08400 [Flavobacteriales bacterium]|nr:hypothetical protein [Flavobacteriales bacterium]